MSLVHTRTLEIGWGDCDPAGIVFHPRYFEWFDHSVHDLFAAATGMKMAEMTAHYGIMGVPVVDVSAIFHAPCRYGDVVRIDSRVAEWKRSSFRIEHQLRHGDTLAVTGCNTRVWTGRHPGDPSRIRAVPLPPDLVAAFDKYVFNQNGEQPTP